MEAQYKTPLGAVAAVLILTWTIPAGAQPCIARQLMTPDELVRHQATMRSLAPAEREAYQARVYEQMKTRAAAKGLTLPDRPPAMERGIEQPMAPGVWGPGYGPGWFPRPGWGSSGFGRPGLGRPWGPGWGG